MSFFSWLCVSGMTITRAIAERIGDQRQADAGIARRALDDHAARLGAGPFASASRMMKSAARSFTDWPGFMNSALPRMLQPVVLGRALQLDERRVADRVDHRKVHREKFLLRRVIWTTENGCGAFQGKKLRARGLSGQTEQAEIAGYRGNSTVGASQAGSTWGGVSAWWRSRAAFAVCMWRSAPRAPGFSRSITQAPRRARNGSDTARHCRRVDDQHVEVWPRLSSSPEGLLTSGR